MSIKRNRAKMTID